MKGKIVVGHGKSVIPYVDETRKSRIRDDMFYMVIQIWPASYRPDAGEHGAKLPTLVYEFNTCQKAIDHADRWRERNYNWLEYEMEFIGYHRFA
jgi:hypothetical protein